MSESSENQILLNEMRSIRKTLDNHGDKLESLAEAFSKMAVQNEQIVYLQTQTSALWKKMDDITGHRGVVTQIRDHQAHCPKEEMHRTFRWMWGAIGTHTIIFILIIGALIKGA
jgi:hypothetical protein